MAENLTYHKPLNIQTFYRLKKLVVGTEIAGVYIDNVRAKYSGKDFRPFSVRKSDGAGFCRFWWPPEAIECESTHPADFVGITKYARRQYVKRFYPYLFKHGFPGIQLLTARGYDWRVNILVGNTRVQAIQDKHLEDAVLAQYQVHLMIRKMSHVDLDIYNAIIDAKVIMLEQGLTWKQYRELYGSPLPGINRKPFPQGSGGVL